MFVAGGVPGLKIKKDDAGHAGVEIVADGRRVARIGGPESACAGALGGSVDPSLGGESGVEIFAGGGSAGQSRRRDESNQQNGGEKLLPRRYKTGKLHRRKE